MRASLTVALIIASLAATNARAEALDYTLEVKGMVCAFCAYNVSKQLQSLPGVDPRSVHVDLAAGRVELRANAEIEAAKFRQPIEAAGFELEGVAEKTAEGRVSAPESDARVVLSLAVDVDSLAAGEFDALLKALGVLASQRGAALSVAGPKELEMRTLRPVLMGRRPALDVHFEAAVHPDNTVLLQLFDASHTVGSVSGPEAR